MAQIMSRSSKRRSLVAHVEDAADEDDQGILATRKYAISEAPSKERPNTGKSRADKRPSPSTSSSSSTGAALTDSDSTARSSENRAKEHRRPTPKDPVDADTRGDRDHRRRHQRLRDDDAARRSRANSAAPPKVPDAKVPRKARPVPPRHSATQPVVQQAGYVRGRVDDPAYYGVKQPAASGSRPRAQERPASYYGGQPASQHARGPAWCPAAAQHPPSPFPLASFPPPLMWPAGAAGASPASGYAQPPLPSPAGPPTGYFDAAVASRPHSRLRSRFDARPSSAMGFHGPTPAALEHNQDGFSDESAPRVSRRPSRSKRPDEDLRRMPPPSYIPKRPQSALPPTTPFRPPPIQRPPSRQNLSRPPPTNRRSVGYQEIRYDDAFDDDDDDQDDDDESLFHDISPNASYEQRRAVVPRPRRGSVVYEQPDFDIVPATGRGRRSSMYGAGALSAPGVSFVDSKLNAAIKYQDEVSGGSQMPLTAETLRKAMKRGGVPSSRSTRSSGSRDDSEYKRSNTTGITRSSYGNEEFTIKVPGNSVVRLQGAEIECSNEGGEITWTSRPSGSRAGSDRASTIYQQLEDSRRIEDGRRSEESRSRMDRKALPHRPRAPSQADSQSRSYAPTYAPYEPAFSSPRYM